MEFRLEKEEGKSIQAAEFMVGILGVGCRGVEGEESKWVINLPELGTLAS